jgi:hypothetical protein
MEPKSLPLKDFRLTILLVTFPSQKMVNTCGLMINVAVRKNGTLQKVELYKLTVASIIQPLACTAMRLARMIGSVSQPLKMYCGSGT